MALSQEAALRKDRTTGRAELQHRHFTTIADIIRTMEGMFTPQEVEAVAHHFAIHLPASNPKFDRKRFLRACGVES